MIISYQKNLKKEEKNNMGNSLFEKLYNDGVIVICGQLNPEITTDTIQTIMNWNSYDPFKELHLYISSYAVSFTNVLAIYDVITSISNPISGYAIGAVGNCATLLLAACDKGKRHILKNSQVGLNEIYASFDQGANQQTEVEIICKEATEQKDVFEALLAKHTGKTVEEIHQACLESKTLSSEEAIAFGIVDKVLE